MVQVLGALILLVGGVTLAAAVRNNLRAAGPADSPARAILGAAHDRRVPWERYYLRGLCISLAGFGLLVGAGWWSLLPLLFMAAADAAEAFIFGAL